MPGRPSANGSTSSREDLRLQLQLEEAVKEWITSDKNEDFLWHGLRLVNVMEWVARTQPRLTVNDQRFLTTSRAVERKQLDAKSVRRREIEAADGIQKHPIALTQIQHLDAEHACHYWFLIF